MGALFCFSPSPEVVPMVVSVALPRPISNPQSFPFGYADQFLIELGGHYESVIFLDLKLVLRVCCLSPLQTITAGLKPHMEISGGHSFMLPRSVHGHLPPQARLDTVLEAQLPNFSG